MRASLPVEAGLYAGLLPMLVYAFLGTSRPLSVSSTSTIAILVAAEIDEAVTYFNDAQPGFGDEFEALGNGELGIG